MANILGNITKDIAVLTLKEKAILIYETQRSLDQKFLLFNIFFGPQEQCLDMTWGITQKKMVNCPLLPPPRTVLRELLVLKGLSITLAHVVRTKWSVGCDRSWLSQELALASVSCTSPLAKE